MKKIFIVGLLFILLGCAGQVSPHPIYAEPTDVDIINLDDIDEVVVGGDTIMLAAVVSPSNANNRVEWISSDENIAVVDENGVVRGLSQGMVIIYARAVADVEIYDTIEIIVYDDQLELETIEEIKDYLEGLLPDIADENLELPYRIGEARLRWSSSDESTISRIGIVNFDRTDSHVVLSCVITMPRTEGEFTKTIMVPKYQLKSLTGRKVTFTYLYDYGSNFKGFREGDLDRIDVINHSFGGIRDGKVSVGGLAHYSQIIKQAHKAGVHVVLAIGGWGVGGFSEASATQQTRKVFIDSIIEVIKTHRFDGIDIDWEYPTSTAGGLITASPADKQNFTFLLKELREAMDELNHDLILSVAVAAGAWAAANYYEVAEMNKYIDYLHVMTYDLINYTTFNTTHHTNLLPSEFSNSSAQAGANAYISRGMDKQKVVMGIAFYGHRFTTTSSGINGIGATTSARDSVSYQDIVQNYLGNPLYNVYYDEDATASWIYGNNTFITYDDPNSIAKKCQYVNLNDLGGVMVWEYCKDSADSALLKAIHSHINPTL